MYCVLYLFMTRGLKIIIKAWYELNWIELNVTLHLQFYCWSLLSLYNIYFVSFRMIEVFPSMCVCVAYIEYMCVWHASIHYIFFIFILCLPCKPCIRYTHTHTPYTCWYVNAIVYGLFTVDFYHFIFTVYARFTVVL